MIIRNGNALINGNFEQRDVFVENGKITQNGGGDIIDAAGLYVLPGFIDTHMHGAAGARFSDPKPDINKITTFQASQGVTAIAATTGSSGFEELQSQFKNIVAAIKSNTLGARIEGIHAEGPFLNKQYKGAMNEKNIITPNNETCDALFNAAEGFIKIISIAPEIENGDFAIEYFIRKGVVVSMGHTNATYEQAQHAASIGASAATHLFNAMRPFNHRETGVLGFALTDDRICCEMICDFVHLHPSTIKLILNSKGSGKIRMVSDTGHAAGMNLTQFEVDGQMRYVKDGVVRLENGTIAGSTISLLGGVKNLYSLGVPLEQISQMVSENPAKTLSIFDRTGSLEVGKTADIVLLDSKLDVVMTLVDGKVAYKRQG